MKAADTSTPTYEARSDVRWHKDKDKHRLVHNSTTYRAAAVRLLVTVAVIIWYALWSFHVTQPYFQSYKYLAHPVYVR